MKKSKIVWIPVILLVVKVSLISCFGQAEDNNDLKDDIVEQTIRISAMLDGSVKNLESAGSNDLMSSGLVGFRYDNERCSYKIAISALTSFDSINSGKTSDFARNMLNTGVTKPGLTSLSGEIFVRFLNKKGFQYFLARNEFLSKKRTIERNETFKEVLIRNKLDDLKWFHKYLGIRIYGEISNSAWKHPLLPEITNVSIGALGLGVTYYKQISNSESFEISFFTGPGLTARLLMNDISQAKNDNARIDILGTDKLFYWGPEIFAGININNVYAKFNLPFFIGETSIDGFTNGQPVFSVGLTADIGSKNRFPIKISDVGNPNVKIR
jgi:hypothetical protein